MTDQTPDKTKDRRRASFRALLPLLPYAARHRLWIAAALLALTIASAATLTVPLAVRRMIDYGFTAEGAGLIDRYFGAMLMVVGVLAAASSSRYYLVMTLGERVVADLRTDVFAHLSKLDANFYDTAKIGELVSRLTADTTQMKSAFGSSTSVLLRNLFLFLGAIGLMIYTSPKLSALVLVAIPLIVLPLMASGRSVRARSRKAQDTLADATAFASENLGAVRTMQAFNAEAATNARFAGAVENSYLAARQAMGARALLTMVSIFMGFASVIGVLWLGAQDVLAGRISGGLLSQFVLYAVFGASSLGQLSEVWSEISSAAGAAGRIAEILEVTPAIRSPDSPLPMQEPPRGEIVFDHVSFAYPGRPDEPVLRDLSFRVRRGETVAIVGPSGAGKSTLFQLIMRFYDPTDGQILLDDAPLPKVDPADVRARIALVAQDPVIFGASVADNIRYGRPDASDADMKQAASRAAAADFIEAMPEGYQTRIGERGITLSGGQRQRLAIARALLKDAPVLLLDEATSALDAENETLVQAALENIMQDRTTLVIAHRLATVLEADRILVMDGGKIVEEGTHQSLVAAGGLYARLASLQFSSGLGAAGAGAKAAE